MRGELCNFPHGFGNWNPWKSTGGALRSNAAGLLSCNAWSGRSSRSRTRIQDSESSRDAAVRRSRVSIGRPHAISAASRNRRIEDSPNGSRSIQPPHAMLSLVYLYLPSPE